MRKKYPINPETGFPELPEGQSWRVGTNYLHIYVEIVGGVHPYSKNFEIDPNKPVTKEDLVKTAVKLLRAIDNRARKQARDEARTRRKKAFKVLIESIWRLIGVTTLVEMLRDASEKRKDDKAKRRSDKSALERDQWRLYVVKMDKAAANAERFRGTYPPKNLNDIDKE